MHVITWKHMNELVTVLDDLIDVVGEDENHPSILINGGRWYADREI